MEQLCDYIRAVLKTLDNDDWVNHPGDVARMRFKWYRFRLVSLGKKKVLEFHKFEGFDHLLCIALTRTCSGYGKPARIRLENHDQVLKTLSAIASDVSINIP